MPACAQSVLDDGAAVAQALQLGAAAVAGRWQPSADGSHYLLLPGAAWRAPFARACGLKSVSGHH